MGDTIDIYVKHAGPLLPLVRRVAQTLDVPGYHYAVTHASMPVEAARWVEADGWGLLDLILTDLGEYGDPGSALGTAFAPYERSLSLDYRGPRELLGRALFDRLTDVGVPLLLAEPATGRVFADFLPGRGVRDFPPGTDGEVPGRAQWFEPALHGDAARSFAAPWPLRPPWPPRGRLRVFETEGLLQCVTVAGGGPGRWVTPKVAVRAGLDGAEIGRVLAWALSPVDHPGHDDASVHDRLAGTLGLSVGDFARGSVSVELSATPDGVRVIPHGPHPDGPLVADLAGPVVADLVRSGEAPADPDRLAATVLDGLGGLRERAGPRPLDADRVVAALRRHILRDDEEIEERHVWPDAVAVHTGAAAYWAQRADWLVTRRPWMPGAVRDAVRVVADAGIEDVALETYGIILERDGLTGADRTLFLNDVTDLWTTLGRWLGRLDPLAFAELVAEFHSGRDITGPVVTAPAVSELVTAGSLIRDVDAFVAEHPSVDPARVCAPTVRDGNGAVEVEFCSSHRYLSGWTSAVDVLRWRVARAPGTAVATWTREYVARGIERP